MIIEFAFHPACAPEGMLTVIHKKLRVMQPGGLEMESKLPAQRTFCQGYTRGAQIFHACSSHRKRPGVR